MIRMFSYQKSMTVVSGRTLIAGHSIAMLLSAFHLEAFFNLLQYDISDSDFFGNIQRFVRVSTKRNLRYLGEPVDKSEWLNAPTAVNAYYNPVFNQFGELTLMS